jgi:hypothetical protein
MSGPTLEDYAERDLKYQFRRGISQQIRKHCVEPDSDPMASGVTVFLGTVLAMAVFSTMLASSGRGRSR